MATTSEASPRPVQVSRILRHIQAFVELERNLSLTLALDESIYAAIEETQLMSAVNELVRDATQQAPAGTHFTLACWSSRDGAVIEIDDGGQAALASLRVPETLVPGDATDLRFIPTRCRACAHCALVRADALDHGQASCADCGGIAEAVPGETYDAADLPLFAAIASALREAGIRPLNAAQLVATLREDRVVEPGYRLRRLVHMLPSLGVLELVISQDAASLRRAENITLLLLEAISKSRSHSGFISAISDRVLEKS